MFSTALADSSSGVRPLLLPPPLPLGVAAAAAEATLEVIEDTIDEVISMVNPVTEEPGAVRSWDETGALPTVRVPEKFTGCSAAMSFVYLEKI